MAFNFIKFLVDADINGNKLLNVADGTAPTDGVNLGQIEALIKATFKGTYDANTNTPDLVTPAPGVVEVSDKWVVSVAGTFFGQSLEVGDVLFAIADDPTVLADWVILQNNIADSDDIIQGVVNLFMTQSERDELVDLDYDSDQTIWMANPGDDTRDGLNPKDAVEDIEVAINLANALLPSIANVIEIKERDSGPKTLINSKTLNNYVNLSMVKSALTFNGGDLTIDGGGILDVGALVGVSGNRVIIKLEDSNLNTTIKANALITEADNVFGQATTALSTPDLYVYIDKIEITDMLGNVFDWPWASNLNIICDSLMMNSTDALGNNSFVSAYGGGEVRIFANTIQAKSTGGGNDILIANVTNGSRVLLYAQEIDVDKLYNVDATSTFIYQYSTFTESTTSTAAVGAVIDRIALLSDISSGGGITVVTKIAGDSPYSAVDGDVVLCNAGAGAITVNLPAAASNANAQITVKKINTGVNAVTVDGNGAETIDGATTAVIGTQFESITLVCDGANWHII